MDKPLYLRMAERLMADFEQEGGLEGIAGLADSETSELVEILGTNFGGVIDISSAQTEKMMFRGLVIDAYCREMGYNGLVPYALFLLDDNQLIYGRPDAQEGIKIPTLLRLQLEKFLGGTPNFLAAAELEDNTDFRMRMVRMYNDKVSPIITGFMLFWKEFTRSESRKS